MLKSSIYVQSVNFQSKCKHRFRQYLFFSICSEFDSGIGFQNKSQLNEHEGQFSASNDLIDTDDFLMPPSFENILRGLGVFPT